MARFVQPWRASRQRSHPGESMTFFRPAAVVLCTSLCLAGVSGCGDSPTEPTPTLATETFTGTLAPLGLVHHEFNVDYAGGYSDASVTVTRLASVADGTDKAVTVGVGFGTLSVGICTRAAAFTNPVAPLNTELPTTGGAFRQGRFCIAVFDNTDAPTVAEPLAYTIVVKHY